jgi:D-tyrosyl-tRNA(Tyr) deacylase
VRAAAPDAAEPLVERFANLLEAEGLPVERGRFGAMMQIHLVNDGPVTLLIEREPQGA